MCVCTSNEKKDDAQIRRKKGQRARRTKQGTLKERLTKKTEVGKRRRTRRREKLYLFLLSFYLLSTTSSPPFFFKASARGR
jgi:hypothetical protein